MEMGWKANVEVSPSCPRCGSSNTKFCYYNNYSLTQPRYFCKACRRYWTRGGSLRNVPVGGGCRKTRRAAKSTRPTSSSVPAAHEAEAAASTTSNIDLAAVYANFVNHAPPPEPNINVPFASIHLTSPSVIPDQEINAFFEFPPRFGGGSSIFPVGFDAGSSFMSMNHDLLPPLPGEETLPLWPNSDDVVQNHQIMNSGGHEENVELVNGNMSVFSGLNLEDIFRA